MAWQTPAENAHSAIWFWTFDQMEVDFSQEQQKQDLQYMGSTPHSDLSLGAGRALKPFKFARYLLQTGRQHFPWFCSENISRILAKFF